MSSTKQENQQRVLGYQAATTLTYAEMEQISGGNAGLYWTMSRSLAASKMSGAEPQYTFDGNWDH